MSNLAQSKNVIQYASDRMNAPTLDNKNTIEGIKTIAAVSKEVKSAILTHEADKDRIVDSSKGKTPVVTAQEIRDEMYR